MKLQNEITHILNNDLCWNIQEIPVLERTERTYCSIMDRFGGPTPLVRGRPAVDDSASLANLITRLHVSSFSKTEAGFVLYNIEVTI